MVIGQATAASRANGFFSPLVLQLLAYVSKTDFTAMPTGEARVPDMELDAQIQRYTTRRREDTRAETHRHHLDFVYLAEGREYLGWCTLTPSLVRVGEYDAERDVEFYQALEPDTDLLLTAGQYALLGPRDVHAPCRAVEEQPSPVTKVIVKIPTACFTEVWR